MLVKPKCNWLLYTLSTKDIARSIDTCIYFLCFYVENIGLLSKNQIYIWYSFSQRPVHLYHCPYGESAPYIVIYIYVPYCFTFSNICDNKTQQTNGNANQKTNRENLLYINTPPWLRVIHDVRIYSDDDERHIHQQQVNYNKIECVCPTVIIIIPLYTKTDVSREEVCK